MNQTADSVQTMPMGKSSHFPSAMNRAGSSVLCIAATDKAPTATANAVAAKAIRAGVLPAAQEASQGVGGRRMQRDPGDQDEQARDQTHACSARSRL